MYNKGNFEYARRKKKNFGDQKQVYVKHGTVKIQLVCSETYTEDPFTKNLSSRPFEFLTSRYVHRE